MSWTPPAVDVPGVPDVDAQAVQLTIANVRSTARWMQDHGGGVAGLAFREHGELRERGIWFGTLEGIVHAGIGMWIVLDETGEFQVLDDSGMRQGGLLPPVRQQPTL